MPRYERVGRIDLLEKFIYNTLTKYRGKRILDVGCGLGSLSLLFKKKYPEASVTGIDINPEYIRIAKERSKKTGLDATFLVRDVCELEKIGTFDLIISKSSFCYWKKPKEALKALNENLSEKGKVIILDALKDSFLIRVLLKTGFVKLFDIEKDGFPDYVSRCYRWSEARKFFKKDIKKKFFGAYFLTELKKEDIEKL